MKIKMKLVRRISIVLLFLSLIVMIGFSQIEKTPALVIENINSIKLHDVLRERSGKIILVNAWATWCEPCKKEMPGLLELKRKYEGKGFELILISADDPDVVENKVQPTLKKLGVDFLTYINRDSSDEAFINGLSEKWSGALPASFLFDQKGKLVEMMVGGKKFEQFEKAVRKLLPLELE